MSQMRGNSKLIFDGGSMNKVTILVQYWTRNVNMDTTSVGTVVSRLSSWLFKVDQIGLNLCMCRSVSTKNIE